MDRESIARRVLFIGGNADFGSVRKRCQEIADAIGAAWTAPNKPGAAWQLNQPGAEELEGRDIFVLVKTPVDRHVLQQRGHVIWDVVDLVPPRAHVDWYLTSTQVTASLLSPQIPVRTIPHHHSNLSGLAPSPDRLRGRMLWIGSPEWFPESLAAQGIEMQSVSDRSAEEVAALYHRADLLVNVRHFDPSRPNRHFVHSVLNSGMKLINAIGFGVPSVTEWEPWVDEFPQGCTLVCGADDAAQAARELLQNASLYNAIREQCLAVAPRYSLASAAEGYCRLFAELAATWDRHRV